MKRGEGGCLSAAVGEQKLDYIDRLSRPCWDVALHAPGIAWPSLDAKGLAAFR